MKKRGDKSNIDKKGDTDKKGLMIAALKANMGVVSKACEKVGISRKTHYEWLKTDQGYNESVEDVIESTIDLAESSLFIQIAKYNTAATIFFLKTRGRERGYIERQELTGAGGAPLVPPTDYSSLTPEERIQLLKLVKKAQQ